MLKPADVHIWEQAANRYFAKAKTPDTEKVPTVFTSFQNLGITNWIEGSRDAMMEETYTFASFMKDLRENFLESGWARKIYRAEVKRPMSSNERFVDFANRIVYHNIILKATDHHSNDAKLRETLTHQMSEGLTNKLETLPLEERNRIRDIDNLNIWMREVETVDRTWKAEIRSTSEMMTDLLNRRNREETRSAPRPNEYQRTQTNEQPLRAEQREDHRYHPYRTRNNDRVDRPERDQDRNRSRNEERGYNRPREYDHDRTFNRPRDNGYNRQRDNDSRNFAGRGNENYNHYDSYNNRTRRCPPLTQMEREILEDHNGCKRCRKPYVERNHQCDWPDAENYKTLTLQDALDARARLDRRPTTSNRRNAVAATMPFNNDFNDAYNASRGTTQNNPPYIGSRAERAMSAPPTSHIREVNAVLPSSSIPFALGNGSDTSDENRVSIAPLTVEHLKWEANVFGSNEFPTRVECLLDNGAHLVLIRPETVADLALPIRKLCEPISVTLALEGDKIVSELYDYVNLQLHSKNNEWTSKTVRALIAPNLCTNILLGLPFLSHNTIVVDHADRTAIDKSSGFDILNDKSRMPRSSDKKTTPPKDKVKRILDNRREMIKELKIKCAERLVQMNKNGDTHTARPVNATNAIKTTLHRLASQDKLDKLEEKIKDEYKEIFRPIPHVSMLPNHDMARIRVREAYKKISNRNYTCPRQYRDAFKTLIDQRLESGFIRPSSSPYASPSFIIPKADKTVLPRWVCDFRELNANTIPDNWAMPRVDEILTDCAKGKIWATIDMTDSFFQTRVHPDDIHKTAVTTPFGTYEWCVMPMGLRNSPAIHQRRVTSVLRPFIGKICHIYLDDIVIWSNSIEEHITNVRTIMNALREAGLHVNRKKTKLFCEEVNFLGHHISKRGIEADGNKVARILDWPTPKSAKEVRQFLGLVRYLNAFLPKLAMQSEILNRLTWKDCNENFPEWTEKYQRAFETIKEIVVSRECLTTIDHSMMPGQKIFVTTDASQSATGAILSFGKDWETARPVAFESMTLKGAELNYPVHEKELLAILRALRKWKVDLLGSEFLVYTDHKTLLNFNTQKELSRRQARWMEELAIYDCKFVYVKGENNSVADALSRYPFSTVTEAHRAEATGHHPYQITKGCIGRVAVLKRDIATYTPLKSVAALAAAAVNDSKLIVIDDNLINDIRNAYGEDPWCKQLISASRGMPELRIKDGLWFVGDRLIVPAGCEARERIFRLAHDTMGHFGFFKTYETLRYSYFWPNMRKDLEEGYIPSCIDCQRNKNSTRKPTGPLHPLPVPDERFDSVAMDFIGPLPEEEGFNCILTMTDRLNSDIQLVPCSTKLTAEQLALLFFDKWYCENGLPLEIISDRDKLFMARFWKHLMILTGIKHRASSAYHPQTDGASERSNKTVNQLIRFHVERNQKGWVRALPRVRFAIMNTVNKSTGYSPFQLKHGRSPRIIPPLIEAPPRPSREHISARDVITRVTQDVTDAKDNLMVAKIAQAHHANEHRRDDPVYNVGDSIMLSTLNRRREYKQKGEKRVAKFMPRFDGPYEVTNVHREKSTVTIDLPTQPNAYPTYHMEHVKPFIPNDNNKYPSRTLAEPGPIMVDGIEEYTVEKIVAHRKMGRGYQYRVRFVGWGAEHERWIAGREMEDNDALDQYKANML